MLTVSYCSASLSPLAADLNPANTVPLQASWLGAQQVFEPEGQDWPELEPLSWEDAVLGASQMAMAYFADQHNGAALRRVPRAAAIAQARR